MSICGVYMRENRQPEERQTDCHAKWCGIRCEHFLSMHDSFVASTR